MSATILKLGLACLATVYLLPSWAALNHNQNSIKALSKAYGFLLGQEYSLKRIESTYPALRLPVETARLAFGASFPGVKEKIERELSQGMGEANFRKVRRELENKLAKLLRQQPLPPHR